MVWKYNASDLPSGSESRQSHVEFIRVNLELLLAVAWHGYESEGRGDHVVNGQKTTLRLKSLSSIDCRHQS